MKSIAKPLTIALCASFLCVISAVGVSAITEPYDKPAKHMDKRYARMVERLGLDSQRAEQVKGILALAREQRKAIKSEAKAQMQEVRKGTREQLAQVLNTEELTQWDRAQDKMRKHIKSKHFEHRSHGRGCQDGSACQCGH